MVGESGIKANSAQLSWSLAELGNMIYQFLAIYHSYSWTVHRFTVEGVGHSTGGAVVSAPL